MTDQNKLREAVVALAFAALCGCSAPPTKTASATPQYSTCVVARLGDQYIGKYSIDPHNTIEVVGMDKDGAIAWCKLELAPWDETEIPVWSSKAPSHD